MRNVIWIVNDCLVVVASIVFIILGHEKLYKWLWIPALLVVLSRVSGWLIRLKDSGLPILVRIVYDPPQSRSSCYPVRPVEVPRETGPSGAT